MGFGVVIIALGYELYGTYALNLAMSLKVYDQNVKIALLYSPEAIAHLKPEEKRLFDSFIEIPKDEYTAGERKLYMRAKLLVNKYSPFDNTIYLDADNIWLDKKISWLFGELYGKDFFIGYNTQYDVHKKRTGKHGYRYWCRDEEEVIKYHKIKNVLPQTVSGFFFFRKCAKTDLIFSEALKVFDDPHAPAEEFAGSKPDEYCFNVALGKLEYTQREFNPIYFDKLHGGMENSDIYKTFWGIAIGGIKVNPGVVDIYNRLVKMYSIMAGLEEPRLHEDKFKKIPERIKN